MESVQLCKLMETLLLINFLEDDDNKQLGSSCAPENEFLRNRTNESK